MREIIVAGRNPAVEADPDRLADMAVLCVACDAYMKYLQAVGKPTTSDVHLHKGILLYRRYMGGFEASLTKFVEPLLEHAPRLRPYYMRALRGSVDDKVANSAELCVEMFRWMKSHTDKAKEIFVSRSLRVAQKLMLMVLEDSPQARLNQAASIPSVSGMNVSRKWIEHAAELAEVPISTTESVLADAETGQAIGDKIKEVQTRIPVTDPMTPEGVELKEEKKELLQQVEEVAATSKAPQAVLTSVVTNLAKEPVNKTAEDFGLDDQQSAAMLARGRSVIAAAAGSGKTRVVIAKLAYLTKDKGIRPEQILATTFTQKATGEMKARAEKFGLHGAEIGTTHHVAGDIITAHGTQAEKDAKRRTDKYLISKLSDIAIAQIQMKKNTYAAWGYGYKGKGGYPKKQYQQQGGSNINQWYKQPVNEWFNMGIKLKDEAGNKIVGTRMIKTAMDNIANRGINAEQAKTEFVKPSQEGTMEYIAAIAYGAYDWLKKHNPEGSVYDYNDWLNKAVDILKNNSAARNTEQSRYKAILVDEAQDLNAVQHEMFSILGEKAEDVTYIGDPNQAIYSWRGAKPEKFSGLAGQGYKVMPISTSYRCGGKILDAANRLIGNNAPDPLRFPTKSKPGKEEAGKIEARVVSDHESGAEMTADKIQAALDEAKAASQSGVDITKVASPNDFGVLVRNNAERDAFQTALIAREIPYRSQSNYFANKKVKGMTAWMTLASIGSKDIADDEINDAILGAHEIPGFWLGKEFVSAVERTCPKGMNYYDHLKRNFNDVANAAYPNQGFRANNIRTYLDAIDELITYAKTPQVSSKDVMTRIIDMKGSKKDVDGAPISFMDTLVDSVDIDDVDEEGNKPDPDEIKRKALVPLRPLIRMAENQQDPVKCLSYIRKMKKANEKGAKGEDNPEPAVQIDTVHQWKGLEKKEVFVSMARGTFPYFGAQKSYDEGNKAALDEERRLAYVAMTRGAENVTILCPKINYMGKPTKGISPFVEEAGIPIIDDTTGENVGGAKAASVYDESHFGRYLIAAIHEAENGRLDDGRYTSYDSDDIFDDEG